MSALSKQIVHYNIHTSLFDIVVSDMTVFNSSNSLVSFVQNFANLCFIMKIGVVQNLQVHTLTNN